METSKHSIDEMSKLFDQLGPECQELLLNYARFAHMSRIETIKECNSKKMEARNYEQQR